MSRQISSVYNKKAFTLVEVLISIVILSVTLTATYFSFSALSKQEVLSRDLLTAKNILTSEFEKVKQRTLNEENYFDQIDDETMDGSLSPVDAAGYPAGFFQEKKVFLGVNGDLKKFFIEVQWTERGKNHLINNAFYLALPPYALPGNIAGTITAGTVEQCAADQGSSLSDSDVQILQGGGFENSFVNTDASGYYDFSSLAEGSFILPRGNDYRLQVSKTGYTIYRTPQDSLITVNAGEETIQNACLTPAGSATIKGSVEDTLGNQILNQAVSLYQDGEFVQTVFNGVNGFSFNVPIEEPSGESFSLITSGEIDNITNSGFPFQRVNGDEFCGLMCPAMPGWDFNYSYRGWSSAVSLNETYTLGSGYITTECSNPWVGSEDADRIFVQPGDTEDLESIILDHVPTTTVAGFVREGSSSGPGVAGAAISGRWWWNVNLYDSDTTEADGSYELDTPAIQELFPDTYSYHYKMSVEAPVPEPNCCDEVTQTQTAASNFRPLYKNQTANKDFVFSIGVPPECGDLGGYVRDSQTGINLQGASVYVSGEGQESTGGGNDLGKYRFACESSPNPPPYCLEASANSRGYQVSKSGYYSLRTWSGSWPYVGLNELIIPANQVTTADFSILRLGKGSADGTVVDSATKDPIEGAIVHVYRYSDDSITKVSQTPSSGFFNINNIYESWPKQEWFNAGWNVPPQFDPALERHRVVVSKEDYESKEILDVIIIDGQTTHLGTIELDPVSVGGGV
ncbi:MAG: prepilin-type N-terminal cleavage/methylation domain-containing protein [Candidatus Aceula meridiana]|nr:prepilin-type N-terminal cleavage/methylation domain-containing protein [Candidatus Aceula meridiana]